MADGVANAIYKYTPSGIRTTFATGLSSPVGLAFGKNGDLFECDSGTATINRFSPNGNKSVYVSSVGEPWELAFDSGGNLFVSSVGGSGANSGLIYKFTPAGTRSTFAANLFGPAGLIFDSNGNLLEAEANSANGAVNKFTANGVKSVFAIGLGAPFDMAYDSGGNLFVADWGNGGFGTGRIVKISPSGAQSNFASGLYRSSFLAFAVPEPSGLILIVAGLIAGTARIVGWFVEDFDGRRPENVVGPLAASDFWLDNPSPSTERR
jgi:sugar lactone lactonase YvrE